MLLFPSPAAQTLEMLCVVVRMLTVSGFPGAQAAEAEREGPVQGRLYRSLKLWAFYCDLEESLGTLESTRAVYDRILDLRIATPQIILNYALFLQVTQQIRFIDTVRCLHPLEFSGCRTVKSQYRLLALRVAGGTGKIN
jgi:hypothetical protein